MTDHWETQAACRGLDLAIWFPERGERTDQALAVCASCPVIRECFDLCSSITPKPAGIWGGTSERMRKGNGVSRVRLRLVESA